MKVKKDTPSNQNNSADPSSSVASKSSSETSVWKKKTAFNTDFKNLQNNDDETKSAEHAATGTTSPSLTPNPYAMENYSKDIKLQKKVQRQSSLSTNQNNNNTNRQTQQTQSTTLISIPPPNTNANNNGTNIAKSPLSQVRLTPLFPTPPNPAHAGFSGVLRNNSPPQFQQPTHHSQISHPQPNAQSQSNNNIQRVNTHQIPRHHHQQNNNNNNNQHNNNGRRHHYNQRQHGHGQHHNNNGQNNNEEYNHCPHGNLSAEELINIKIRKRNVCYVVGLPIHVATEIKLRSNEWFGQFGNIATIAINRNSKSIQANSIPAHITYDNDISALNAINFCNKFIFADGRKLKATFGTQHYCRWFIAANKKCTNVFCGFRHSWCRQSDIITQKDINDFKGMLSARISFLTLLILLSSVDHNVTSFCVV